MRRISIPAPLLPVLAAAVAAPFLLAQPAAGGTRPPRPPIDLVLDANGDEVIDADEIANAPAALLKLDRNHDGRLTPDEYRPPRPEGAAGRPATSDKDGKPR